jgi:hypothetical protein
MTQVFGLSLKPSSTFYFPMYRRFLLTSLLLIFAVQAQSQITFLKIFGDGTYCPYGSALPNSNYVCTVDTVGTTNYLYNGYGTPIWKNDIPLNGDVIPASIMADAQGHYIFAGTIIDSSGDASGLIARLDSSGDTINYKTFSPLNNGNYGMIALPTMDSNYVFDVYENGPGTSSSSTLYKLDIGFNTLWSGQTGTSGVSSSGILQDADSNFVFTDFDQQNSASISAGKFNNNGLLSLSKNFNDSTGCSCFSSYCITTCKSSGYIIGAEFQQKTLLIRVDDSLNIIWKKQLNWGNSTPVSIAHDRNDGYFSLINYQGTTAMYHFDSAGDSIALYQFNPMVLSIGSRMERCVDGGFLISGTTYDYYNVSHGFLLKIDSLIRFVPQGHITSTGPNVFCHGDSITLTGPNGNYHFNWSTGDTTQAIVVHNTGTYYLTLTSFNGNTATLTPVNVVVSNPPAPQIINHIDYLQVSATGAYYQWYFNGVQIPNASDDTLFTNLTGNFNVVVIDSVGCIKISPLFYYSLTGLNNVEENSTSVYPVPAANVITVSGKLINETITISDIRGRTVVAFEKISSDILNIDVSRFQNGTYFLRMKNTNKVERILIAH